MKLWDIYNRVEAASASYSLEIRGLFFMPDGRSFATVDADGWMTLLDASSFEMQTQLDLGAKTLCGDLAPGGTLLALGCEDGQVRFVAVDGFEEAALVVPATQGFRQQSSLIGRLLGKSKAVVVYQFTCPACRLPAEATGESPDGVFLCPGCERPLHLQPSTPQMQPW
jgi:hypothetical protein